MKGVFLTAALIVLLMVLIKDGRFLHHRNVTGGCVAVAAPAGQTGAWERCTAGKLQGAPDLRRQGCSRAGVDGTTELWRCPERIQSSPGS
jgi:hypothetical protein